ncbi:hypothetical protein HUJ04_003578 [Dendroctonus ponderosae]|uniref:Serine/threonine-protein phosphatase 4 regulatory subunit 4 n=1 Tax=Dendroctonus ponderosae TaxID=77166 RepID=A0AAR5PJ07_DENPD|nr:hypothetical protein HUJ04_003578 [Dendroctonus ponderosae]
MRMDEEMRMLQLDKPGQGKSTTELQKHSIDEVFYEHKPVDRALFIVSKGDELQKLSVIGSLPELLKYDQKGTVSKIIPKIQQELPNSSSEFNLAVSRMFNILIHMDIPVNLVPQILQGIDNRDPMISNAWMETLLAVIPLLKEQIVKNDILKCAIAKSQLSKAAYFRVSSCKILGEISVHKTMNPFEVKKDVLPLVQSLCQDCFFEVRAAMCRELPNVAQGLFNLGDAIVKVNLLPLLVELSADENVNVRSIAIESMVSIIPFLSPDTIKGTIIPLAKKLCTRSASEGDTTYTAISSVFSMLINNLQPQMSTGDSMWFLDYFNHICRKGLSLVEDLDTDPAISMLCRENCANCLPKVVTMVLAQIPTEVSSKWYHTFKALAADPCYIVRRAVANRFSDIVRILGPSNKIVVIDFTKLLRDEDEEVLQALIPNVANIMELFTATNVLQREIPVQATLDIGRAMLKCQNEAFRTNNWRMKECLLMQWERLPNCFPSDFIHQHFSPVVLNATIYGKAKPVRSQAARTLLIILKYSLKENHRKWIREMIQTQLCNAPCCYSRQVYITLCTHAIDIFSWGYFKEYFYLPLLSLAEDQIAIVRLSMVKLCPILKQMLNLPADRALQLKLENILSKMEMMEADRDVIMMLKLKLKEMRTIRNIKSEVLVEDRRRADEEDRILKGRFAGIRIGPQIDSDLGRDTTDKQPTISVTKSAIPKQSSTSSSASKRAAAATVNHTPSLMPFLDQHFYTDAGVALPQDFGDSSYRDRDLKTPIRTSTEVTKLIESAENLTSWLDEISMADEAGRFQENIEARAIKLEEKDMIISVENINPAETLTENDIKALATTTTNMTDELKVNIQHVAEAAKELKPKMKRNSCVFSSEIRRSETSKSSFALKRRSLNISNSESKIPIPSRTNSFSFEDKSKSFSDHSLDAHSTGDRGKISRFVRHTKSSMNLRTNVSDKCNNSEGSLQKSDDCKAACRDISRIPAFANSKFVNSAEVESTDYMKSRIRRRFSSTHKLEMGDKAPICFKRFSANDLSLGESLTGLVQTNVKTIANIYCEGTTSRCSKNASFKPVENKEKNSGLPVAVRKKPFSK